MNSIDSFYKHVFILVDQSLYELVALNEEHVCCPSDETVQVHPFNQEVHIQPHQTLAGQTLQNVIGHLNIKVPSVLVSVSSSGAYLYSGGIMRSILVLVGGNEVDMSEIRKAWLFRKLIEKSFALLSMVS